MSNFYDLDNPKNYSIKIAEHEFLFSSGESVTDVCSVVSFEGRYYAVGMYDIQGNVGVHEINEPNIDEPDDLFSEDNVICPYCGFEERDSWELSDDDDNHECGQCGAIFAYGRHVSVTYSMDPVRPPEIKYLTAKDEQNADN